MDEKEMGWREEERALLYVETWRLLSYVVARWC